MRGRGVLGAVGRSDARKDQSALGLVGVLDAPDPASWKTEIGWPIFRSDEQQRLPGPQTERAAANPPARTCPGHESAPSQTIASDS